MMRLWDLLKKVAPAAVTKKTLQRAWSVAEAEMEGLRMDGGGGAYSEFDARTSPAQKSK